MRFTLLLMLTGNLLAQQTSITLSTSVNPVVFGQPLTFTATVAPSLASGSVTFYDGTTVLGTKLLSSGQASFTTILLAGGARSLRAYYSGGGTYRASTSAIVAQTVSVVPGNAFGTPIRIGAWSLFSNLDAVGDFNGDGKLDLALAGATGLAVLLGNGDGTFTASLPLAYGMPTDAVATGDFNGDGKADLAVSTQNGTINIFLGNGDGTFQPPVSYPSAGNSWCVAVGDFNGDGKADLAVTNNSGVSVLLGLGDGTFQTPVGYSLGGEALFVAVGDFNGDGKADLAVTGTATWLLLGNGDGSFQTPAHSALGQGGRALAIADFNGDGKADLALANGANGFNVTVLLGNGDGTFQAPVTYFTGLAPQSIAVADFNGDRKPDLVLGAFNNLSFATQMSVLLGNGDGTFQPASYYQPSGNPNLVMVGDFNGDGRADVAVAGEGLSVFLGESLPVPTISLSSAPNPSSYGQSVTLTAMPSAGSGTVAFYDGTNSLGENPVTNGHATLTTRSLSIGSHSLTAHYNGSSNYGPGTSGVLVLTVGAALPAAACTLATSQNPVTSAQYVTLTATVSPIAGGSVTFYDGLVVLGAKTLTNGQAVLRTNLLAVGAHSLKAYYGGDGSHGPSVSTALAQTVIALPANGFRQLNLSSYQFGTGAIAVGDFDGDGRSDLAVSTVYSSYLNIQLGNGDGTFRYSGTYNALSGSEVTAMVVADFNGDGKADLAIANINGPVTILLGNGDGTFQPAVNYAAGEYDFSMAAGDFNGDGFTDLVITDEMRGCVTVLLGNGDGTFQAAVPYVAGEQPFGVAVGDFNGDGKLDLAVSDIATNSLMVLFGNGDGLFQPPVNRGAFLFAPTVLVGDVNGDGKQDLVLGVDTDYTGDGEVTVLLGNGDGTFRSPVNYAVGFPAALGDFNGDGKIDVLVGNNGLTLLLLGNGNGTFQPTATFAQYATGAVGDFNGDGRTDIVSTYQGGTVSLGTIATQLTFATQPVSTEQGAPLPSVVVQLLDAGGNVVMGFTSQSVTLTSTPAGVSVTAPAVNGIATFNNLVLAAAGSYTLTTTSSGLTSATSTAFNIVNAPPSVAIDSPAAGSVLTAGPVVVSGWALDSASAVGTGISRVQVKLDGTVVGNATYGISRPDACAAYPDVPGARNVGYTFSIDTAGVSNGTHTITVVATDSDAAPDSGSANVTFTLSNTPPSVHIDAPVPGSALSGVATISGWAIDNTSAVGTAISSVRISVDGTIVANATYGAARPDVCSAFPGRLGCPNVGFTYALNTSSLSAGSHVITATAMDSDGFTDTGSTSVTVTVASAPPSVYIDNPAPGTMLAGTALVSGWALDNSASVGTAITGVVVKVDGNVVANATYGTSRPDVCTAYPGRPGCPNVGFTYSLDTTKLTTGSHTLTAVASDSDGIPDSASWTVVIQVSAPPMVVIDSIAPGATVGGTVTVSGWALDNATAIGGVQVKVDGTVVGNATYGLARPDVCTAYPGRPGCPNVGFSFALNTASLGAGTHAITVVATDTDGTPDTGSYTITVTVTAGVPPPVVYVDSLAPGAMVSGTVMVSGWALDVAASGTPIGSVQVKVDGAMVGTATYGTPRPDVCAAFPGRSGCPNVGFTFALNTASLISGPHIITVVATDTDVTPDSGSYSVSVMH